MAQQGHPAAEYEARIHRLEDEAIAEGVIDAADLHRAPPQRADAQCSTVPPSW